MTDHVYKIIEIVGASTEGADAAIRIAVARARKSLRNVRWYEVIAQRGFVDADGQLTFQVTLRIGFTMDD